MLENQLGKIIAYERKKSGISVHKLCSGLCSGPFLFRVETGERTCEKILADALLQRMGVSGEKFVYIINPEEQEWLLAKERLIQVVDEGDMKAAQPIIEEYKRVTAGKSKLHRQFLLLAEAVLEWKNGLDKNKIQDKLKASFEITMLGADWSVVETRRLSLTELVLEIMHGRIAEEQHDFCEAEKVYSMATDNMLKFVATQDCVKLYPQVAYRLVSLLKGRGEKKKAFEYVQEGIKLLKKCGNINYMRHFLEQYNTILKEIYGECVSQEQQDEVEQNEKICVSLKWLYEQYGVIETPWRWNIPFSMGEVEVCHEVIKKRRKVLGLSQEQLAEGICDPVSMSRIESGKVKPKTEKLKKIMEKVGMAGESFVSWHQVNNPELLELTKQITDCLAMGKLDKVEALIEILEKNIILDNRDIRQYFEYIKSLAYLNLKKIDKKEHWEKQEETLYITLPKVSVEKMQGWAFSSQEVEIINSLSYSCEEVGKQEEIVQLLKMIIQSHKEKLFSLDYYVAGIELTTRNLGNLLGNMGKYKEAIETADYGIYWALRRGNCSVLKTLLYDRGWDMEQLWEKKDYTQKESLKYIEASLALSTLLENDRMKFFICRHIEKLYDTY